MPPSRTGPILQRSTRYADLTDEEVADLELRDFEKVLRLSGLTKAEHKDAMARRRRVKNRFSARKSIHKKLVVKDDLLGENERLRRENIALRDQNKQLMKEALDRQRAEMEARMSSMYAELVAPELRDGGSGGPARPDVAHEA